MTPNNTLSRPLVIIEERMARGTFVWGGKMMREFAKIVGELLSIFHIKLFSGV